jgi:hypothetical protein
VHCRWSQWSCTVGWPVQAAWPTVIAEQQQEAPFPTTVHRSSSSSSYSDSTSNDTAQQQQQQQSLLAVGYSDGSLRTFKYPAVAGGMQQGRIVRGGHGGPVGTVRFSALSQWLISVSPETAAVFVRRLPAAAAVL